MVLPNEFFLVLYIKFKFFTKKKQTKTEQHILVVLLHMIILNL